MQDQVHKYQRNGHEAQFHSHEAKERDSAEFKHAYHVFKCFPFVSTMPESPLVAVELTPPSNSHHLNHISLPNHKYTSIPSKTRSTIQKPK